MKKESLKRDKSGHFKPRMKTFCMKIELSLYDDLKVKAAKDKLTLRVIGRALFDAYVKGVVNVKEES